MCVCMCIYIYIHTHASMLKLCLTLCNSMDCRQPRQTPLSMEFSRQEYWSGLPFPSPGDLPDPGIEPMSLVPPALQADSLPLSHWGNRPLNTPNPYRKLSFDQTCVERHLLTMYQLSYESEVFFYHIYALSLLVFLLKNCTIS